jgi:hypothetical protein
MNEPVSVLNAQTTPGLFANPSLIGVWAMRTG